MTTALWFMLVFAVLLVWAVMTPKSPAPAPAPARRRDEPPAGSLVDKVPAPPRPCLRCARLVECPEEEQYWVGDRTVRGSLCLYCRQVMQTDPEIFWADLHRQLRETS